MPISPKTLNAIQAAGTAAFKADAQLKAAVKDYGSQVQTAMLKSPFDLANDNLFEDWKSVSLPGLRLRPCASVSTQLRGAA